MKAKTIRQVLRGKIDDWLKSITDEDVRELAARDTLVTGGAIASMLLKEKVNDYDVYFRTRETAVAVAKYYVGLFKPTQEGGIPLDIYVDESLSDRVRIIVKSAGVASEDGTDKPYQYFEARPANEAGDYVGAVMDNPEQIADTYEEAEEAAQEQDDGPKYRPVFISTNAITLSHKVQIVLRFYGEPEEIHENYDFVHCTNFWLAREGDLVLRPEALEALLARELRYIGSKYPICSVVRLRKFIKRNWTINAGQILKMAMQISQLDLTKIDVLQDQLTGVDMAYFTQVITALREKDPEKVNTTYLIEIIDRMF